MTFKKILIPVDFSTCSEKALDYGLYLAEKFCSHVVLFHAVVLMQENADEKEHDEAQNCGPAAVKGCRSGGKEQWPDDG